jgi:predicted site-specific integrase-resolvase
MKERELVTAKEICKRFDIPRGSLHRLVKEGRIPAIDVRKGYHKTHRWLFDPAEVERVLGAPPQ